MQQRADKVAKDGKAIAKVFDEEAKASGAKTPDEIKAARGRVVDQLLGQSNVPTNKIAEIKNHLAGLVGQTAGKDSGSAATQFAFAFSYYGVEIHGILPD
jgi:hypothetical protein